jgi:probable rRNA maturation factor
VTRRCSIAIVNHSGQAPEIDLARLQQVVDVALGEDGLDRCHLTVLLVDDAESAQLHLEHFGDGEPTDVMSFPDGSSDPETGFRLLGDLAVGAEVARREAAARGRSVADELLLYVLHGLLHLLGHDDQEQDDRIAMWGVQRRLLSGIGIEIEPAPDE